MSSASSVESRSITDWKGVHSGKRLFILASGPSLGDVDVSRLDRRIVMGLNRSFLKYSRTHYHCVMDERLFELYPEEFKQTRCLITLEGRPWGVELPLLGSQGFSEDLAEGIYSGYTVSYFALQVAAYMGFTQVFFLGLDLKQAPGFTHFFGSDFSSSGHEKTEFPRMAGMLSRAATVLKGSGMEVYNCSPVSTLECFPFMSFEDAIAL